MRSLNEIVIIISLLKISYAFFKVTENANINNQVLRRKLDSYPKFCNGTKACSTSGPVYHSPKKIISGKVYFYHIFIGSYDQALTPVTTLHQFITDLSGSMLSKIMLGYKDSYRNISSTNYVFRGNYINTTSLTSINDAYVYDVVKTARQSNLTWSTPVSNSLYLVVFNGNLIYNSEAAGSSWNTANGWCGFHSNNLKPGAPAASKYIIMPVGGTIE